MLGEAVCATWAGCPGTIAFLLQKLPVWVCICVCVFVLYVCRTACVFVCVCVFICVCVWVVCMCRKVCVFVSVCLWMCVCEGQRTAFCVLSQKPVTLNFEARSLTDTWSSLIQESGCQPSPRVLLSPPSQCWSRKRVPPSLAFISTFWPSPFPGRHFTNASPPP